MSKLNLTDEELELVKRTVQENNSEFIWYYISILVPFVAYGIYGIIIKDYINLAISMFGLLGIFIWHLYREVVYFPIFKSIFQKIVNYEHKE